MNPDIAVTERRTPVNWYAIHRHPFVIVATEDHSAAREKRIEVVRASGPDDALARYLPRYRRSSELAVNLWADAHDPDICLFADLWLAGSPGADDYENCTGGLFGCAPTSQNDISSAPLR